MMKQMVGVLVAVLFVMPSGFALVGIDDGDDDSDGGGEDYAMLGGDAIERGFPGGWNLRERFQQIFFEWLLRLFPILDTRENWQQWRQPSMDLGGGVDQSQEDGNGGYVEIYGDVSYAQGFTPTEYGQLTGIEIMVERQSLVRGMLSRRHANEMAGIEPLYIQIWDGLDGDPIAGKLFQPDEVSKNTVWLTCDFTDRDIYIELGHTYYIVLSQRAGGGNQRNHYKWYYGTGDCYEGGEAYSQRDDGSWQPMDDDFAFRSLGEYTGDEPDGIVDRWAFVVGTRMGAEDDVPLANSGRKIGLLLQKNGWETSILLDSVEYDEIEQAISTIMDYEDQDDIVLFSFACHGNSFDYDRDGIYDDAIIATWDGRGITASDLNDMVKHYASQKMIFIFEACQSGGFITATNNLTKAGRAIITSSTADKLSYYSHILNCGYLTYYLCEGLQNPRLDDDAEGEPGYREISLEEVYPYVYEQVVLKIPDQQPQFWTGIPGEVGITFY